MNFLIIDTNSPRELLFDQWGEIFVYDITHTEHTEEGFSRTVSVTNNTTLYWYGISEGNSNYTVDFQTHSGESIIRFLLLSKSLEKLQFSLTSSLASSQTVTNIHILSLVGEGWIIELNGTVHIRENINKVRGHILEENIFLGSKGQIRWIPSLLVYSDDVEAGHAARIEKIPDEKLYYLRARGIPRDDASVMMIESAVIWLFEKLHPEHMEQVKEKVLALFGEE